MHFSVDHALRFHRVTVNFKQQHQETEQEVQGLHRREMQTICFCLYLAFSVYNNKHGAHSIKFSQKNIKNKKELRASLFSYRLISKSLPS